MLVIKNERKSEIFYATRLSAGFDICAGEAVTIEPGAWALIGTGLRIIESQVAQTLNFGSEHPALTVVPEMQIRPRSGLAAKQGITVLNTPATVDADYRGEIKVTLINHSKVPFKVEVGDRIAQGVCALAVQLPGIAVRDVERGEGGFGSTGK